MVSLLVVAAVGFGGVLFGYLVGFLVGSRKGRIAERERITSRVERVAEMFPPGDYRGGLLRAVEEANAPDGKGVRGVRENPDESEDAQEEDV